MSFMRKVFNDLQLSIIGIIDANRIARIINIDRFHENKNIIKEAYTDYVNSISSEDMALSLSTAAFCKTEIEKIKPKSILDLGSGFSSYVFRSYSEKNECSVTSVDTSETWLQRTTQYLQRNRLNIDNLISWDDFINLSKDKKFDFILHDIGDIEMKLRTESLPLITKAVNASGMILLDDMHKTRFRPYAYKCMKTYGFKIYSARKYTLDTYGRFSAIAICGGPGALDNFSV